MNGDARPAVLIVDDDAAQHALIARLLGKEYECVTADSVRDARAELADHDFAAVLCDINMPGTSGLEFAREIAHVNPDMAVTMVTGVDDPHVAEQALESGATSYIVKPFRATELRIAVANSLRRKRLERSARAHADALEADLFARTAQLQQALASLEESQIQLEDSRLEAIQRLSLAVEARDCVTADHVTEMIDIVERFAVILGYEPLEARMLGLASSMHDVGKIGIPDSILLKPGPLTHDEREIMQRHCMIGFHILDASPSKVLQLGAIIALSHHERFDGHGYPRGLLGRATPIEARIVQIVDVYSALTSVRPYRDAMLSGTALRMIRDESGTQFDPKLVEAFIENFDAIADTESQYRKTKPPSVASVRQ